MNNRVPASAQPVVSALNRAGLNGDDATYNFLGRFSNDVWRVTLSEGRQLIAKIYARADNREYRFYGDIGGRTDLPIPPLVAMGDGVLVLEHSELVDFDFASGPSDDHAETAQAALARLHASYWHNTKWASWLPSFADPAYRHRIQQNFETAWRQHAADLHSHLPEFSSLGDAMVGKLADALAPLGETSTLLHGDAHAENIPLTTHRRALILDWEDPLIGSPGFDLAVYLTLSWPTKGRRQLETRVVEAHVATLAEQGCQWPDAWTHYRLGVLRRVASIVEIAGREFSSLPWVFRRSAQAALDLRVGELLEP